MIRNKKGSHVGIAISFIIFTLFLSFMYAFLSPNVKINTSKQYLLENLRTNLIGNFSAETYTMMVDVVDPVSPDSKTCINLQNIFSDEEPTPEGEIPTYMINNLSLKDKNENILTYDVKNNNNIYVNTGTGYQGLIEMKYSPAINKLPYNGNQSCDPHDDPIGYLKEDKEIYESQIYQANESYYSDYNGFKNQIQLPENIDFSFKVLDSERNVIIDSEISELPSRQSVYTDETPIEYIDDSENIKFGFLVLKIW